jgi:2-oxoisovalerate dehydrogenase E1 component beta subunit
MAQITLARALNEALRDAMEADDRVVLLGEDVGTLGGVFRITDGLLKDFGEQRVMDTPLAESAIMGVSVGLALRGYRPVPEMQFDGFSYPALDQIISHLAKYRNRSAGPSAPSSTTPRAPRPSTATPPGSRWSRRRRRPTPTRCCASPSRPTTR